MSKEQQLIDSDNIKYGLFDGDVLIGEALKKPDIAHLAVINNLVKSSFQSVSDFKLTPHLKDGVVCRYKALEQAWYAVSYGMASESEAHK